MQDGQTIVMARKKFCQTLLLFIFENFRPYIGI
jgi:hypothetical protein